MNIFMEQVKLSLHTCLFEWICVYCLWIDDDHGKV